jgi:SAM-dependent methyltransferase
MGFRMLESLRAGGILDDKVLGFYESLATRYHLIFEDWDQAIDRQARVLSNLLEANRPLRILDCACGIGTQAIGFARSGHKVTGSDVSEAAVMRARHEAKIRGVEISFVVSDMTRMSEVVEGDFDVVAAMDNALPHLSNEQVRHALRAIGSKLARDGRLIASIRDYDELIIQRPTVQQPAFYGGRENDALFIRFGIGSMGRDMSFIFTSLKSPMVRGQHIILSLNIDAFCVKNCRMNWSLRVLTMCGG